MYKKNDKVIYGLPPKPFFWVAKVMGCLGPLANRPLCDYELKVKVTNFVANGQLNHTIILAIRGHRYVNIRYAHIIMNIFFTIREFLACENYLLR
jgi:hypothetical protein